MKLLEITVENFRGLPDGTYSLNRPLTVVTGAPACGKTSLLEAIVANKESVGAYGLMPDPAKYLRRGAASGRVLARWLLNDEELARTGLSESLCITELSLGSNATRPKMNRSLEALFKTYSPDPSQGKFEYFHAARQLSPQLGPVSSPKAFGRLTRRQDKYSGLENWLFQSYLAHLCSSPVAPWPTSTHVPEDGLSPYRQAIRALCPELCLSTITLEQGHPVVWFARGDTHLTLYELSQAEQQAVLFAVSFCHFGLQHSIILVDEPELHIHSQYQSSFLQALSWLGHDNQFIVATQSKEIANGVATSQLLCLKGRPVSPPIEASAPNSAEHQAPSQKEVLSRPYYPEPQAQPRLSLEQLACMRAEILITGRDQFAHVLSRYGLNEALYEAENDSWNRQFQDNGALLENYKQVFEYYRAVMAQGRS